MSFKMGSERAREINEDEGRYMTIAPRVAQRPRSRVGRKIDVHKDILGLNLSWSFRRGTAEGPGKFASIAKAKAMARLSITWLCKIAFG
jgi:hypothetical protein